LLGLLCWLGKCMWDDISAAKTAGIATQARIETMTQKLEDHESRIRQNEKDIITLQSERMDRARSPKDKQNN
jgi:hypothetical protein